MLKLTAGMAGDIRKLLFEQRKKLHIIITIQKLESYSLRLRQFVLMYFKILVTFGYAENRYGLPDLK